MELKKMTTLFNVTSVKKVTTRPVTARAMQFRYQDDPGQTRRLAEAIVTCLGVTLTTSYDSQSGTGYHLRSGDFDTTLVCNGDWILIDSFGKATVVKEKDFNVYFEPEITK